MSAGDFSICPHAVPCARQPIEFHPGYELYATMAQRLDDLMRRCREEGHTPTYADLQALKGGQ